MKIEDKANGDAGTSQEAGLYPYTSLVPTLKIADAVKELGGARSEVSKSRLAAHFKESEKSASFLQRISSAKVFGLIVGRSDYSLSDAAKRYYSPTSDQERSNALLEFLTAPTSFREIIRLFDGEQLPKREILGNIFSEKLKVPESWKDRAAAFFENSAQFVGVIDENRILRFKATQHTAAAQSTPTHFVETLKINPPRLMFAGGAQPKFLSDQEEHSLFLDKDKQRKFSINSPLFISRAEYDRICKWIEVTLIVGDEKTP
ncbi:MAG TPA: hypothetical protein VGM58_09930 [Verrucomicrobiae bacterium]|jgi:hypothetical protein